ncbi:MAG: hypothetical protein RL160_401 [Bacteroidota bacterium]
MHKHMKKYLGIFSILLLLTVACNPNDTSYSDKERDSLNKVDSDTAQDLFQMIEAEEQKARDSGQSAPGAKAVELSPIPLQEVPSQQNNHPGPIQPPKEGRR